MMKRVAVFAMLCIAAPPLAVKTAARGCTEISGKFNEFILPRDSAPTDPFGRILGNVDGSLEGAVTAFLTSLAPGLDGGLHVTVTHAFATQEGNLLLTRGVGDWTFIKNGFYQVDMTVSIVGGTGRYTNATGTFKLLGVGNNVGPGTGQFLHEYRGQLCTP